MNDDTDSKGFEQYGYPIGTPVEMLPDPPKVRTWAHEVEAFFHGSRRARNHPGNR